MNWEINESKITVINISGVRGAIVHISEPFGKEGAENLQRSWQRWCDASGLNIPLMGLQPSYSLSFLVDDGGDANED